MYVAVNRASFIGMFEPCQSKLTKYGLLGASAIVNCVDNSIPVRLLNVSDSSVTVNSNFVVGMLSECSADNNDETFTKFRSNKHVKMITDSFGKNADLSSSENNIHVKNIIDSIENNANFSSCQKQDVVRLVEKHSALFSFEKNDIGFVPHIEHEIIIKENSPCQQIHSRVPVHVEEWVDNQVNDLLKQGIIRESHSPWSAPIVVVKKKNGDFRLCIDYRRLNSVTIKPTFQIPDSRTIFDSLSGSTYFSAIDISSAYYQCAVKEDHKKYTAFTTRKGQFEFNRMPFGLSGAPFTFQRLMNTVLREENWQTCLIYLDDVLIFSKTFTEHLKRLDIVFSKLEESGIKLSPRKCQLLLTELCYLGHKISKNGIEADPSKIEVLKSWPIPKNVHEMRSFLGFCNYYRRFINDYAKISKVLEETIKTKNVGNATSDKINNLNLSSEQIKSFHHLIDSLCNAPCLAYPQNDCTFILDCDASSGAIGAVLSQIQNNEEKAIAYGSRKLSKAEEKYCITRKELLAVYYFVTYYKHYLLGKHFIIRTDHKALQWMLNWEKPTTSQYCSWIAELEIYNFTIKHRAGVKHQNADFLSRPCMQCELMHEDPKPKRNVKVFQISESFTESNSARLTFNKIRRTHNDLGHIGITKLQSVFEVANFSLPNINKQIENVIANCLVCQERKSKGRLRNEVSLSSTAKAPFESIMLDIAGPLPRTNKGNVYLLAVVDIFSRFIRLIPLKEIRADVIIDSLKSHWIPFFGYPTKLFSDCGTNFKSEKMTQFCVQNSIEQIFSSPYHHQSNGIVERYFRTAKDMLYASSKQQNKDWDSVIPQVELGLRCSKSKPLMRSPFEIIYGTNPRVMSFLDNNNSAEEIKEKRDTIQKGIKEKYKLIEAENMKQKNYFIEGDKVMVKCCGKKPNINERRYFGPCTIVKVLNPKSYQLKYGDKVLHRNFDVLKPFRGNSYRSSEIASSNMASTSVTSLVSNRTSARQSNESNRYPIRQRQHVQRYGFQLSGEGDVI